MTTPFVAKCASGEQFVVLATQIVINGQGGCATYATIIDRGVISTVWLDGDTYVRQANAFDLNGRAG